MSISSTGLYGLCAERRSVAASAPFLCLSTRVCRLGHSKESSLYVRDQQPYTLAHTYADCEELASGGNTDHVLVQSCVCVCVRATYFVLFEYKNVKTSGACLV